MHFEILTEDRSGASLLDLILPKVVPGHTWRILPYKGLGKLPVGMTGKQDSSHRILPDRLPILIHGYASAFGARPGIAIIVVVDADRRPCTEFLGELSRVVGRGPRRRPHVLIRIAIEEIEAWLLGDRAAVLTAYPRASKERLDAYVQDSVCGTWETLADVVHPGGRAAVAHPGAAKSEWAKQIGAKMDVERNASPSFAKFRDGLRRLAGNG